jgi:hypothetical protein
MSAARSLAVIALMAVLMTGSIKARAQEEQPPDLRMLLNLDLFRAPSRAAGSASGQGPGSSMLEQIRTLEAMGYLGANPDNSVSVTGTPPTDRKRATSPPLTGSEDEP